MSSLRPGARVTVSDPDGPFDGKHGEIVGIEYVVRFNDGTKKRLPTYKLGPYVHLCPECTKPIGEGGVWDAPLGTGDTLCSRACAIAHRTKACTKAVDSFMGYVKRLLDVPSNWTGDTFRVQMAYPQSGSFDAEERQALVDAGFTWSFANNTLTVVKGVTASPSKP